MIKKTVPLLWLLIISFYHKNNLSQTNPTFPVKPLSHKKQMFSIQASNVLFEYYPQLKQKIPYVPLAQLPTPVQRLEKISRSYDIQLYIKRDDLTGGIDEQGVPLYGGNKVRKLEFLLAQAKAFGAKKVLTFGAAGSNHALATAAHAQRLGMQTICMLKPQINSAIVRQNLLMHLKYGSELFYHQNDLSRNHAAQEICCAYQENEENSPYVIPTGGSNIWGTLGFVNAAFELNEQIKQGLCPKPTHVYVACGSCSTTAGLLLGCKVIGLDIHIIGIAAEPDHNNHFAKTIAQLFHETNEYLHAMDSLFPLCSYTEKDVTIDFNFCGLDYGVFTQEGGKALDTLLTLECIPLEGTYTANTFAALLATAPKLENAVILFWNTYYNPCPAKKSAPSNYLQLPACFHAYFRDV